MKISRLIIPDFQQFKDFDLDLTYPEGHERAGEPLDKICFIGGNGTGKSTLLQGLNYFLFKKVNVTSPFLDESIIKIKVGDDFLYWVQSLKTGFNSSIENGIELEAIKNHLKGTSIGNSIEGVLHLSTELGYLSVNSFINNDVKRILEEKNKNNTKNILIYLPAESSHNSYSSFNNLPDATLNEALGLFKDFSYSHIVSNDMISAFWRLLIYHLKKRENDWVRL